MQCDVAVMPLGMLPHPTWFCLCSKIGGIRRHLRLEWPCIASVKGPPLTSRRCHVTTSWCDITWPDVIDLRHHHVMTIVLIALFVSHSHRYSIDGHYWRLRGHLRLSLWNKQDGKVLCHRTRSYTYVSINTFFTVLYSQQQFTLSRSIYRHRLLWGLSS